VLSAWQLLGTGLGNTCNDAQEKADELRKHIFFLTALSERMAAGAELLEVIRCFGAVGLLGGAGSMNISAGNDLRYCPVVRC
jgi:hypothetical protein